MTATIPHHYPVELTEEWITDHSLIWEQMKTVVFAISDIENGRLLGAISLMDIHQNQGEIGHWIGTE